MQTAVNAAYVPWFYGQMSRGPTGTDKRLLEQTTY